MSALIRSSRLPLHPAPFVGAAIAQDEGPLPSPIPSRAAWRSAGGPGSLAKGFVNLAGASVGLLLLAPVMLAIALLIRLDSPGPALFRQVRRGHRGRPFRMLKFRTMVVDAERRLGDLESCNESAGGVLFKLRDDPRVTRLGRFLRRSSLDELPQLINVLRGEMSLVGPRPLQLRDSERLAGRGPAGLPAPPPGAARPHGPVAGRTAGASWTTSRWSSSTCDYVVNRTLGPGPVIIGKTVLVVLRGRGDVEKKKSDALRSFHTPLLENSR